MIKFRGKAIHTGAWITGGYHKNDSGKEFIIVGSFPDKSIGWSFVEIEPGSAGQFAGLVAKNKQDIYEGDVVRISAAEYEWVMQIKPIDDCPTGPLYGVEIYSTCYYDDDKGAYEVRKSVKNAGRRYELPFLDKSREVIGNVHENPELPSQSGGVA